VFAAAPTGQGGINSPGSLLKCATPGGALDFVTTPSGASEVLVSGQTVFVAVQGTTPQWTGAGIYWSPTGTLSLNQGSVGAAFGEASSMTADSTYLYFWTIQSKIYRCTIASHCTDATAIAFAISAASMKNDAKFLYWAGYTGVVKLAKSP
jgi:hypothetical protein